MKRIHATTVAPLGVLAPLPSPVSQRLYIPEVLPGLNELLKAANKRRGKWNAYDAMKKQWQFMIVLACREQELRPVRWPVLLHFTWQEVAKRRDLDNIAAAKKLVIDALVAGKILPADGWTWVVGFSDRFEVQKPGGVLVTIEELSGL